MNQEYLQNKLINQYGQELTKRIFTGFKEDKIVSFRINTIKTSKDNIESILNSNSIPYEKISWSDNAIIVHTKEEELTKLDIYTNGEIYLQSLSSQLPPLFLNPQENELILDMAAAPGGKTTEIAALSNNKAMITAIEKNKIRSERLQYNINKQGAKKVSVLNTDARNLNEYFMFDKILLDAPCSGSGTITNNDFTNFNEELVTRSVKFQTSLIEEAIKHLNVGGELIYSTCSILKEENEDIINYCLNKFNNLELVPLDLTEYQDLPNLPTKEGTLCICPTKYYEGFYIAKLRRTS